MGKADTQGDGTIPVLTAIGTFSGNTRANIELKPFPDVGHTKLPFNKNVQQKILETLGVSLDEELISTSLNNAAFATFFDSGGGASGFGITFYGIISADPVESFLVDGSGRRLGYSNATGPVTEIPNSFWLGNEEGIGGFTGALEGPFQLQLIGLGEEYFVSVSLETEAGPGGIEVEGFLAQGEQKIVDIPVNNAPILDLNGSTEGINFSTTFGASGTTAAIVDPSLILADLDSANLQSATITLTNPQDNASEFLNATPVGNTAATYNPTTSTLTLSGSAPLGDGIVQTTSQRGNTFLQLDPDGFAGNARPHLFARVIGVTEAALNDVSNFVF